MSTEDFQLTSDGVKYSPVTIGEHDDRQSIVPHEQHNGICLYEKQSKSHSSTQARFQRKKYLVTMPPRPNRGACVANAERSGYGRGVPSTAVYLAVRRDPAWFRGGAQAGNAFWRILNTTERSFLHLYADVLSS